MLPVTCNIDKSDRINRTIIGAILIIAALAGMGKLFFTIIGFALFIEGIVGWCSISYLISRFKSK